jgi:hypothetical protein
MRGTHPDDARKRVDVERDLFDVSRVQLRQLRRSRERLALRA